MVQMIDLKRQFEDIREEVVKSLVEVLESTRYVLGPKVEEFENMVACYIGRSSAIGVASGTDALHLALKSLGIGKGDEVITTPFTFFATVEAILYEGARPVFVDIEPNTFNIDPSKVEEKVGPLTKAILPVHMFGHPADMKSILDIAGRRRLSVIEDCAQAFGATVGEDKVGSFGDIGCFSFYPSKNLGAYGDGGMIVLDKLDIADDIRKIRNHGSAGGYIHADVGVNSRLDELQAAVLIVKMKRIDHYNDARRKNAELYNSFLSGRVGCPVESEGFRHVYHQYTITSPRRDEIKERLQQSEIASTIYYPVPLHLQPALEFLAYKEGDFPAAERAAAEVLSLPMYPELEAIDIERISEIVLSV